MSARFEMIERLLRAILHDLSGVLTSAERAEVVEFIEVGEYGVALETLAALIVEERKLLPLATHVPGVTNPDGTPWLPINQ